MFEFQILKYIKQYWILPFFAPHFTPNSLLLFFLIINRAQVHRFKRRAAFPFLKNSNQNNLAKLKNTKKAAQKTEPL